VLVARVMRWCLMIMDYDLALAGCHNVTKPLG
jgi:hypothetical protein